MMKKTHTILAPVATTLLLFQVVFAVTNTVSRNEKELERVAHEFGIDVADVSSLLEEVKVVMEQFQQMLASDPDAALEELALLAEALVGSASIFNSDPAVAQGDVVPQDIFDVSSTMVAGNKAQALISEAGFMGIPRNRFSDQLSLFRTAYSIAQSNPSLLVELLKKRANSLPPTAGDVVLSQGIQDGVSDNRALTLHALASGDDSRRLVYEEVRSLATAQNPVYRLLGLSLLPSVATNSPDVIDGLDLFSADTDPAIRKRALDSAELASRKPKAVSGDRTGVENSPQVEGPGVRVSP